MRYTLLLHYSEPDSSSLDEAAMAKGQQAMTRYAAALHEAGVLREAQMLQPTPRSTTLTMVDGTVHVQEGALAGTTPPLAGFAS